LGKWINFDFKPCKVATVLRQTN